jgi:hypothetical protein
MFIFERYPALGLRLIGGNNEGIAVFSDGSERQRWQEATGWICTIIVQKASRISKNR